MRSSIGKHLVLCQVAQGQRFLRVEKNVFMNSAGASALLGVFLTLLVSSCNTTPTADTPSGALRLFFSAMEKSVEDPDALRVAYFLLDAKAREELRDRAKKAETLAGYEIKPWEMLVPGRFRLHFAPVALGNMRERISNNRAIVVVKGSSKEQQVQVQMVRESGGWRVELPIPKTSLVP